MTDRNEVELMLKHEQMERLRRYMTHGRELAHLSDFQLIEAWVHQMNTWAAHAFERHSGMLEDCVSEMTLRKIELPFERVEDAMIRLVQLSRQYESRLLRDPERLAVVEAALRGKDGSPSVGIDKAKTLKLSQLALRAVASLPPRTVRLAAVAALSGCCDPSQSFADRVRFGSVAVIALVSVEASRYQGASDIDHCAR
jgi:hypothetical protein